MKAWYPVKPYEKSHNKVGIITDIFYNYVELQDVETKEYYIRHISLIEII